jgi:hypothetical protein
MQLSRMLCAGTASGFMAVLVTAQVYPTPVVLRTALLSSRFPDSRSYPFMLLLCSPLKREMAERRSIDAS